MPEPVGPVVANTTPLIALAAIGRLDLLPHLYGGITISEAVAEELAAGRPERIVVPNPSTLSWITTVPDDQDLQAASPKLEENLLQRSLAHLRWRCSIFDCRFSIANRKSKGLKADGWKLPAECLWDALTVAQKGALVKGLPPPWAPAKFA